MTPDDPIARQRERQRRRRARIREGWDPPGPQPPGDRGDPTLRPSDDETLDFVCGQWRIFQRRKGHRFSTDDFVCAWYAASVAGRRGLRVRDYLDLGTGIGSVALMVAWRLRGANVVGVEAQPVSAALARRSIRYNGIEDRMRVVDGDLRDPSVLPDGARFDLITGSPPYLPRGTGVESRRQQRAPARFGHRGLVDDYARAAARALRPGGLFALVHAAYRPDDVPAASDAAGLTILERRQVIPKVGKDPLLELFTVARPGEWPDRPTVVAEPLTVRDEAGAWTEAYQAVRTEMGFPSPTPAAPRPRPPAPGSGGGS